MVSAPEPWCHNMIETLPNSKLCIQFQDAALHRGSEGDSEEPPRDARQADRAYHWQWDCI